MSEQTIQDNLYSISVSILDKYTALVWVQQRLMI